jgi:hypothetical protein
MISNTLKPEGVERITSGGIMLGEAGPGCQDQHSLNVTDDRQLSASVQPGRYVWRILP